MTDVATPSGSQGTTSTPEMSQVTAAAEKPLNIGQFDVKDPNAWFFRAEMMFRIRSVNSEKRKAELVMECLPPACWNVVAKFFDEHSGSPTYTQVKEELLEHWDTKPATRAKQFFAHLGSSAGDTNISTMFHTLETLTTIPKSTTRDKAPLNLVMKMTLQLYPKQVRAQLPDYTTMTTKNFLRQADRILAAYSEPDTIAAATPDSEADSEPEVAAPARLKSVVARPPQQQQETQQRKKKPRDVCYYHTRFGLKAYRCQPPCQYSKNE